MTDLGVELVVPPTLSIERRDALLDVAERNDRDHGASFLGMVLSGSAGRGMATAASDVDVYVILADDEGRSTTRSPPVDEIPYSLSDLADVAPFHSGGWWFRWSFAWAPVLLDRTDGHVAELVHRQATVTDTEAVEILVDHDRLDGWVNYAFRALKSDRDGLALERRLDAAESMPWATRHHLHAGRPRAPLSQVPTVGAPRAPAARLGLQHVVGPPGGDP